MKTTKELARELGFLRRRSNKPSKGVKASRGVRQPYSYLVVIDFESTCWKDKNYRTQEVIEFPAVLLNTATGECESEFHYYVQPSEQPTLSDFCKELTGISQGQVEDGIPLSLCMKKFGHWIDRLHKDKGVLFNPVAADHPVRGTFVTWSDWDLGVCLQYECRRKQITKPVYLNSWIDIRATYRTFYDRKPNGLNGALQDLGITFAGRQHSGVDDARNTARLAWRMICDGCVMNITKSLNKDIPVHPLERPIDMLLQRVASKWNGKTSDKVNKKPASEAMPGNSGDNASSSSESITHRFKRTSSPCQNMTTRSAIQKRSRLSLTDKKYPISKEVCLRKVAADVTARRTSGQKALATGTLQEPFRQQEIFEDIVGNCSANSNSTRSNSVTYCDVRQSAGTNQCICTQDISFRDSDRICDVHVPNMPNPSKALNVSEIKSSSFKAIVAQNKENLHPAAFTKPVGLTTHSIFKTPSLNRTGATGTNSYDCMKTPVGVSSYSSKGTNQTWSSSKATPPLCKCGRRSKLRIVQSPGPNQGRCFFGCSVGKRQGWLAATGKKAKTGCDFFKWASSVNIGQRHFTPLPSRNAMSTGCIQRQQARTRVEQTSLGIPSSDFAGLWHVGSFPLKRCLGMQTPSVRGNLR